VKIHRADEQLTYDGSQLSSHFAYRTWGIQGDSIVSFKGPMDIPDEHIADLEDLSQGLAIRGSLLVHFIVEHFGISLENAILRQRLLARLAADHVAGQSGRAVSVRGDDLFVGEGKLSVSIAAPSPVSCLIHLGLNISPKDVPVRAAALLDLGVDPDGTADAVMRAYADEIASVSAAAAKVKGVP